MQSIEPVIRELEARDFSMQKPSPFGPAAASAGGGVGASAFGVGDSGGVPVPDLTAADYSFLPGGGVAPLDVSGSLARYEAVARSLVPAGSDVPASGASAGAGASVRMVPVDEGAGSVFSGHGGENDDYLRIVARLMAQLAASRSQVTRNARLAALTLAEAQLLNKAAHEEEAARQSKSAAKTVMGCAIGFGVVGVGAGMISLGGAAYIGKQLSSQRLQVEGTPRPTVAPGVSASDDAPTVAPGVSAGDDAPTVAPGVSAGDDAPGAAPGGTAVGPQIVMHGEATQFPGGLPAGAGVPLPPAALDNFSRGLYALAGIASSVGGMGNGVGQGAAADDTEGAKLKEADGTRDGARAEKTRSYIDIEREIYQGQDEVVKAVIAMLMALETARAERMKSITQG